MLFAAAFLGRQPVGPDTSRGPPTRRWREFASRGPASPYAFKATTYLPTGLANNATFFPLFC